MEEKEKIRKLRARLEKLEQQEKERAKRQRAVEREKKRKAEVRSAIVLMAILKKMALENETAKRVLDTAASKVSRPQDRAALETAGYAVPVRSPAEVAAEAAELKRRFDEHIRQGGNASGVIDQIVRWELLTGEAWSGVTAKEREHLDLPPHPKARPY